MSKTLATFDLAHLRTTNDDAAVEAARAGFAEFIQTANGLFGCEIVDDDDQAHPWWFMWDGTGWIEAP